MARSVTAQPAVCPRFPTPTFESRSGHAVRFGHDLGCPCFAPSFESTRPVTVSFGASRGFEAKPLGGYVLHSSRAASRYSLMAARSLSRRCAAVYQWRSHAPRSSGCSSSLVQGPSCSPPRSESSAASRSSASALSIRVVRSLMSRFPIFPALEKNLRGRACGIFPRLRDGLRPPIPDNWITCASHRPPVTPRFMRPHLDRCFSHGHAFSSKRGFCSCCMA